MKSLLNKWVLIFLFQRDRETDHETDREIYLWYNSDKKEWFISRGTDFKARNRTRYMYIKSSGKPSI